MIMVTVGFVRGGGRMTRPQAERGVFGTPSVQGVSPSIYKKIDVCSIVKLSMILTVVSCFSVSPQHSPRMREERS